MGAIEEELLSRRHRITVSEYYRMGISDRRVELVAGEIIDMSPIGPEHSGEVDFLTDVLKEAVGTAARVRVQQPVTLDEYNEPEPDLAVVKPRADRYRTKHPTASDTFLVVEVADSTLRYDRDVKALGYAASGIPELWVVDVKSRQLHIYRSPGAKGYADASIAKPGKVVLAALPEVTVELKGLFST
jgi:Uma2 family endonuclease